MYGNFSSAVQNKLVARLQYEVKKREIVDASFQTRVNGVLRASKHAKLRLESEFLVSTNRGQFELTHELRRIERDLDLLEHEILESMRQTKYEIDRLEKDFPTRASYASAVPSPFNACGGDFAYSFAWSKHC